MMTLRSSHVCRWNSSSVRARRARSLAVRLNGGGSSELSCEATILGGRQVTAIGTFWDWNWGCWPGYSIGMARLGGLLVEAYRPSRILVWSPPVLQSPLLDSQQVGLCLSD